MTNLMQLVLIIDFGYSCAEAWYINHKEEDSTVWLGTFLNCSSLMFIGSITSEVFVFVNYCTHTSVCKAHKCFISFNMLIRGEELSLHSILPALQDLSGLLQISMISFYIMFLTWSAISSFQWAKDKSRVGLR